MDLETAKTLGLALIGVLGVGGVLLALLIRAIVGKVVLLVVVVAAGSFVFSQRAALTNTVCSAQPTFLGVSVSISPDVRAQCTSRLNP